MIFFIKKSTIKAAPILRKIHVKEYIKGSKFANFKMPFDKKSIFSGMLFKRSSR